LNSKNIRIRTSFKKTLTLFTLLIPVCFSCYRDVIDLDLEDIEPQIVIEGIITDQPGPYQVRISKTGNYNQLKDFPPVSGAEVFINDNHGKSEMLREIRAGLYETQELQGMPGRTYTLKVNAEGKEYSASSRMPEALTLDYVGLNNYGWGFVLICAFTDRQGIEDYCRLKIFKNEELVEKYLYQGRFNDGEQYIIDDFDVTFSLNDYAHVQFLTLNKATYEYLSMLDSDEGGGNYDPELPETIPVTWANPKTNLSNNALGYFSAHTVRNYTRIAR